LTWKAVNESLAVGIETARDLAGKPRIITARRT